VQNAAARLLTNTRRRDHTTPVLRQLHWLPVQRRVELIACLAHQFLTPTAPTYLSADIQLVSEHGRRHLRSSSCTEHSLFHAHVPLSATEVLLSQDRVCGTVYRLLSDRSPAIYGQFRQHLKTHLSTAQKSQRIVTLDYSSLYKHSYLLTYLLIHRQSVIYCSACKDQARRTCVLCHWPDSLELTTV